MKGRILIILLLLNGTLTRSQFYNKPFIIGSEIHSGFNIPVYQALGYLVQDDIFAADLSVSFQSTGKDHWEKLYNYPRSGLGFSAWTLGNNEILGNAFAAYSFINVPLKTGSGKFSLNMQTSAGAAYLPYKFDIRENPLNRAIGSNYNIYIRLAIEGRLKILPLCELVTEAGLTHFSNGKTRSPNYGINAATMSLGVNCLFNQESFARTDPEIPEVSKKYIHSFFVTAGSKVYDNLYGKRYLSLTSSYNLERYVSNIGKAGLGADLFYDASIGEALGENGIAEDDFLKLIRAGIHASYALRYKRMTGGLQVGYYVYSKKIVLTSIFNKLFLQYLFTDNIAGSLSIRSHWGKADSFEYGIGYVW